MDPSAHAPAEVPVLAVDIGGTKLAAARVTGAGKVLERRVAPTRAVDAEDLWRRLVDMIDDVRTGDEPACGVGCGGPMWDDGHRVSPLNIPVWREFPLAGRLADHLDLPVAVDNDAKALALGEGRHGGAVGESCYLAMVVSTGVGGGIVLDGRLLDGRAGNAGHIGHVVVEPGGRLCACGARGCLEAEASGTAILAATGRPAVEASADVRRRTGTLVGRAVGSVVNLLDLSLALVAGSVALGFGADFFDAAQDELDRVARPEFARGARIRPAGLGPDGPLVGAAALAHRLLEDAPAS